MTFIIFSQVTIDDLIPGSRYKFRIKSENNYGISEPGDESDPFDVGGASADRYEITYWNSFQTKLMKYLGYQIDQITTYFKE